MKVVTAELKNILLITLGSALLAFGVTAFLLPAKVATGGTPGLSIIIYYITDIPVSLAMLIVNIPLIMAGMKFISSAFAVRTVFSVSMTSLFIGVYPSLFVFPSISEMLLSTLYGGICIGVGVALIIKGQASAGGTTIIARIIANYSSIKPAQAILVLDTLIIIAIAIIYQNMELALWSLISIYVTAKIIDKMLSGGASEKVVHIVSDNAQFLGSKISAELGRTGTILSGQNLTMESSKEILFVMVGSREIEKLKTIINQHDKQALVIVMEASEIMGTSMIN
ncbi:YitT family protein [Pseudocolwellia agarivorans]|uniref:YitT family protein n=1 Tax=Pseudocolwellia agarivorans TaxID=1911682 RepID=UPI0015899CA9|nr:YitT family protein [Pseudocolwellia agarivorans]